MGNSVEFMSRIPENLSTSQLLQLQEIIEEAIIRSPWTEDDPSRSSQNILRETISEMHKRGYRPISAEEYQECLTRKDKKISLWVALNDRAHEKQVVITLPVTTEELTERVEFIVTHTDSATVLTDAETLPWATNVHYAQ